MNVYVCFLGGGGGGGGEGRRQRVVLYQSISFCVKISELYECSTLGMVQSRFCYSPH